MRRFVLICVVMYIARVMLCEAAEIDLNEIVCAGQSNMVGKRGNAGKQPAELSWIDLNDLSKTFDVTHYNTLVLATIGQRSAATITEAALPTALEKREPMIRESDKQEPAKRDSDKQEPVGLSQDKALKVFVCAGQSNMVGKRASAADLPEEFKGVQKDAFFFDGKWIPLEPGKTEPVGFGPEISFAKRMAQKLKEPVGIIKHSKGGTDLATGWSPIPDNRKRKVGLYFELLNKVNAAKKAREIKIIGFVWIQGAADSKKNEDAEAYQENMEKFIAAVRKDYGSPKMAFVAQRLRPVIPSEKCPYMETVRKANMECKAERYQWVNTDDIERGSDNAHFTTAGYVELGVRSAEAMMGLLQMDDKEQ